jgi:hypothetical protein
MRVAAEISQDLFGTAEWRLGVSAGYGETVVLEDIDLALAPGECISYPRADQNCLAWKQDKRVDPYPSPAPSQRFLVGLASASPPTLASDLSTTGVSPLPALTGAPKIAVRMTMGGRD